MTLIREATVALLPAAAYCRFDNRPDLSQSAPEGVSSVSWAEPLGASVDNTARTKIQRQLAEVGQTAAT